MAQKTESIQRILIVEDDQPIREVLTLVLEDAGYEVISAANGQIALDILNEETQQPGLILLDLMMPIMNGWDFRIAQQQDPTLSVIPVVVLSADRSIQEKALSLQAAGFLRKPVDIGVLLTTVEQHYR